MYQRMRWTLLPLMVLLPLALALPNSAWAGNTHSEGGAVLEDAGVPETDGIAPVTIYWTGDPTDLATTTVGTTLSGHWLQDVGFMLDREWQVGDDHVAVLEFETNAGSASHSGYYGVMNHTLTSYDPDEYADITARAIPVPVASAGPGFIDLVWNRPAEDSADSTNIAGFHVFRSQDGIAFAQLTSTMTADSTYQDSTVTAGETYYYAVSLSYRGGFDGTAMSANSNAVVPLDTTPPNAPTMSPEPSFTQGLENQLTWSDESATGATEYYIEAASDAAFASIVGNSGWIASTTHTFTGLADGDTYFYRVRARDSYTNESNSSAAVSSRQDASAPSSNLLALTGYKTSSTVDLEWTANDAVSGVQSVELFYAKDGASYQQYAGGPFSSSPISFDASTTGGDGDYEFYTVASDSVGNGEGAPESPDASTTIDTQAPNTPTLAALPTYDAGSDLDLSWDDQAASGATSYRVEASTDPGFSAIDFTSNWINQTNFTFNGLADATTYHYRVQSRDDAGNESAYSSAASSTQDASPPVTAVDALPEASNAPSVDIAWNGSDAVSGLTGVELYYSHNGAPYVMLTGGPFTTSPINFDFTTMGGDGTYAFYTIGTDQVGNTEAAPASPDAQIAADTDAPNLPAIAALPAYTAGNDLLLSWSDESASGATSYYVEASTDPSFATIDFNSGWIIDTSFTFNGLDDATQYHARLKARDAAGNETSFTAASSTTMDATPAISSASGLPQYSSSAVFDIAYTASDATSGVANVDLYYSLNGAPYELYAGGPFSSSPISFDAQTAGGEGAYEFYTVAHDVAGNAEAAPTTPDASTTLDTQAPDTPTLAALPAYTAGTDLLLSWNDLGSVEYLAEAASDIDFNNILASSNWIGATSFQFTGLSDGTQYFYRTRSRDAAGNESAPSAAIQSTQDATSPESNVEALSPVMGTQNFDIAWSGSDATSGVQEVDLYFSKDGASYALYGGGPFTSSPIAFDATSVGGDGSYAFFTIARDTAGNEEGIPAGADAQTQIDTAAPGSPTIAGMQSFTAGDQVTLSWSDESATGATEYYAEMSTAPDFAAIAANSGWTSSLSHVFTALTDGQSYYFRVRARDNAQNETGNSGISSTTMDATAPESAVDALPAYSPMSPFDIAWTASDATSGVESVQLYYARNGAAFALYPGGPYSASPISFDPSTTGGAGDYAFFTRAMDGVGNEEAAAGSPDASTTIDTQAPNTPTLAALPNYLPGTSADITWDDMSATGAIEYWAQAASDPGFSGLVGESGWIAGLNHTFTNLANGQEYFYRVKARDAAMNETTYSATQSATQDASPPSSEVSAMPALINAQPVQIDWSGFDILSGVDNVDLFYSKDGSAFTLYGAFNSNPIAFDPSTTGGDGNYAFFTRARDGAGNYEAAPAAPDAQTRIDTAAPETPEITGLPQYAAGSSIALNWSNSSSTGATDYMAEAATDPSFASLSASTNWIPNTSYVFNGLNDGTTYYFRVKARDAAQNETPYAAAEQTTMDDTAPASNVDALASVFTTETFDIPWSGSDATSGLASVDLYYAIDGGAFTAYPGGPFTSSPITFDITLAAGEGQYDVYTRARDQVGNRETAPSQSDESFMVSMAAVGIAQIDALPEFSQGVDKTLDWQAANNATDYLVQAAEDANFDNIFAASGWISGTSYTFNNLIDGDTYYFRLRGRSEAGVEGDWSQAAMTTMDATPPSSQVAQLSSKATSQAFDILWSGTDATSGISGVELMVSRDGGAFSAYPGGPFASSPIAFDASTMGGDGYFAFYTIAADNAGNIEAAPAGPDAETSIDTTAPQIPSMLAEPYYSAGSSNNVTWAPISDAIEYFAQCALDAGFQNVIATSGWITTTNHTFTNLQPGVTYYYRARARDASLNTSDYSSHVTSTQAPTRDLAQGWNLVSFDVIPEDPAIDKVFADVAGSFSIIRSYENGQFHTYVPTMPVESNDLQVVDPKRGYWIYMNEAGSMAVAGNPIADNTPIDMNPGWELVSYLPDEAQNPSTALFSINESLILARGYDATNGYRSYYPGFETLSDLTMMDPGSGYWMYMGAADQLVYSSVGSAPLSLTHVEDKQRKDTSAIAAAARASKASDAAHSVPTVMDLYSKTVTIDGEPAAAGTVIEAFDESSQLLASAVVVQDGVMGILHLHGDVSITETDEGATSGESITLKVRGQDVELVMEESISWSANDHRELNLTFVDKASLLPKAYALDQNYPNPFNPATTISYAIPGSMDGENVSSTKVSLRIFDIRGRQVRNLIDARQVPGNYTVRWNGKDDRGATVSAGVYFYRLQTEHLTKTRKMMMVK